MHNSSLQINNVTQIGSLKDVLHSQKTPLFLSRIHAGFPSPADDFIESSIDLNEQLIQHPEATFFLRVSGDSMIGAGIHDGDLLIVDRALEAKSGRIVIAALNGEMTVKRLQILDDRKINLLPENNKYQPIAVLDGADFQIWGVVTQVIHYV